MTNSLLLEVAIEIVDLSITNDDFPQFFVCVPEGMTVVHGANQLS